MGTVEATTQQPRGFGAPPTPPSIGKGTSRARRPLADEVRDAITEELIVSGAVQPGERLPPEVELCQRYEVSRITVRAALRSLQDAGFIKIRQGQGSTVLPRPQVITSGIDQLCSFETFAAQAGRVVTSDDLVIEEVTLDEHDAGRMGTEAGTRALLISRTKLYDGRKVGWIVDYVLDGVLPFATITAEFRGSVLDVLLAHQELAVTHSDCELVPVGLDAELAERLNVTVGSPALFVDELTCTSTGQIVNWSQAWLLPDHFRFQLRRRR